MAPKSSKPDVGAAPKLSNPSPVGAAPNESNPPEAGAPKSNPENPSPVAGAAPKESKPPELAAKSPPKPSAPPAEGAKPSSPKLAVVAPADVRGEVRIAVWDSGVDTALFRPDQRSEALRSQWGADEHSLVLLVVGRLAAEKNLDAAMAAFDAMRAHHPDVKLVFVGSGPLQAALQQRCSQAVFAGTQGHGELAGYYASADLLLFPSLTETFGNVTLEALASGLPVLAFNTAAACDWVLHQRSGWLVDGADTEAFAAQARALALQPHQLAEARLHARSHVAQLDWHQIAAQVEGVFLETMARQHGHAGHAHAKAIA